MKTGIGVSAGSEVVCAALVVVQEDGSQSVEHRTVSADREVNTDVGELVTSAIDLMTSLARVSTPIDGIAVTYRTDKQLSSIRSALSGRHRAARLVPESAAAAAFFDDSGLIARYDTVAIVDVGATGTTTSIIDTGSGHVRVDARTDALGGNVVNRLVRDFDHAESDAVGSANEAAIVDRSALDDAIRARVEDAARFTSVTAGSVGSTLDAVALIGGGAAIASVRAGFEAALTLDVVTPAEPDTVLATGAALLALSKHGSYPTASVGTDDDRRSLGRLSGILAGAVVAGGLVLAYGVQALTPSDNAPVSPVGSAAPTVGVVADVGSPAPEGGYATDPGEGTSSSSTAPGGSQPYSTGGSTAAQSPGTRTTTRSSSTPTLRPAPDLPVIPWPAQPMPPATTQDPAAPAPQLPTEGPSPDDTTETPTPDGPDDTTPPGTTPPVTTPPVTTPPVTTPPVTTPPGTTPPTATPEEPAETPDPTESSPAPEIPDAPTVDAPTTDVDSTPNTPGLTPPPTVWTPPPTGPEIETSPVELPTSELPSSQMPASGVG